MYLYSTQTKNSHHGPLWFIQLWVYSYFPKLALSPKLIPTPHTYGEMWMLGEYVPGSISKFKDYFEAFSSLKRERPLINLLLLTKILEKPMMILLLTIQLSQTSYFLLPPRLELCEIPFVLPVDWFLALPSLKISQNKCPLCFHIILLFALLIKNKIQSGENGQAWSVLKLGAKHHNQLRKVG